jgi:hypothetical protein
MSPLWKSSKIENYLTDFYTIKLTTTHNTLNSR